MEILVEGSGNSPEHKVSSYLLHVPVTGEHKSWRYSAAKLQKPLSNRSCWNSGTSALFSPASVWLLILTAQEKQSCISFNPFSFSVSSQEFSLLLWKASVVSMHTGTPALELFLASVSLCVSTHMSSKLCLKFYRGGALCNWFYFSCRHHIKRQLWKKYSTLHLL